MRFFLNGWLRLCRKIRPCFCRSFPYALVGLCLLSSSFPAPAQPEIQHWLTQSGSGVYFVHVPGLPMVDISMLFDAGSVRDGPNHGLALFVAQILEEGAGGYQAVEIYRRFAEVGAEYGASAGFDRAEFSLRSLTEEASLPSALQTFVMVLTRPDFPQASLDRLRQERLTLIKKRHEDPGVLAEIRLAKELYADHPYAHPSGGYEHSVKMLTKEVIRDFYKRYYTAGNLKLVFVGNLPTHRIEHIANQISGAFERGNKPPPPPKVPDLKASKIVRIDYPARQTHVLIGQLATKVGDPLNVPLYLGNFILGGSGFGSRLLEEIRVQRGLAYDAYSYFYPRLSRGPFRAAFQTRNDSANAALQVAQRVLARFVADGPSESDLRLAKQSLAGGFSLRFASNSSLMRQIVRIAFYDLPLDTLNTYIARIQAQSRDQVIAAFRERMNFNKTVTVMVGEVDEKAP